MASHCGNALVHYCIGTRDHVGVCCFGGVGDVSWFHFGSFILGALVQCGGTVIGMWLLERSRQRRKHVQNGEIMRRMKAIEDWWP